MIKTQTTTTTTTTTTSSSSSTSATAEAASTAATTPTITKSTTSTARRHKPHSHHHHHHHPPPHQPTTNTIGSISPFLSMLPPKPPSVLELFNSSDLEYSDCITQTTSSSSSSSQPSSSTSLASPKLSNEMIFQTKSIISHTVTKISRFIFHHQQSSTTTTITINPNNPSTTTTTSNNGNKLKSKNNQLKNNFSTSIKNRNQCNGINNYNQQQHQQHNNNEYYDEKENIIYETDPYYNNIQITPIINQNNNQAIFNDILKTNQVDEAAENFNNKYNSTIIHDDDNISTDEEGEEEEDEEEELDVHDNYYSRNNNNNILPKPSSILSEKDEIKLLKKRVQTPSACFKNISPIILLNSKIKPQDKYKAKLCIGFCFTVFSFIPSWIIFFWLSGLNKPAIMAIFSLPMCFSSLLILKKTGSTHIPGHLLCFTLCFALTINSYYTGGHQSTIRLLMSTIPIISALVIGRKASVQWSLIVLIIFLFFFIANLSGYEYVEEIPTITIRSHMNFIIDVTIVLITMAFTLCYQYFIDEAHRETKLKNAQLTIAKDAAIEAYQARQEFLATMSHEIRTPLNGLIGMATLLRDSNQLPHEEKQMAKAVKSCGDILLRLVNDILDLSKLEANQMGVEHIPFRVREMTQEICHVLSGQAQERGLKLYTEVSDKVPHVLTGDTGRILQVLMNLTGNALKFTATGSVKIIVDVIEDESEKVCYNQDVFNICFRVKDTGIGVPQESHQKIFEAFVQADPSDSRKYGGSGLGLYLCAKLVKLMKGEIGVYNNPDAVGSTFWFILPLEGGYESNLHEDASSLTRPGENLYSPNCIKVLIAEDNLVNQRVAVKFLEKIGIKADVAANGNEVLAILDHCRYDLIFMDFQMPILDGLRCSRAIRTLEKEGKWHYKYPSIFICGLTANTMTTDKKRCFDHGMNHFISKPFQMEH
eukprot:gene12560-15346_t